MLIDIALILAFQWPAQSIIDLAGGTLLSSIGIDNAFILCPTDITFGVMPLASSTNTDSSDTDYCDKNGVYARATKYLTPLILKSLVF